MIYSDTAEEHITHVKLVLDVLKREKFYLSEHKLNFFSATLRILGHVIDDHGVRMDPDKVDKIAKTREFVRTPRQSKGVQLCLCQA